MKSGKEKRMGNPGKEAGDMRILAMCRVKCGIL